MDVARLGTTVQIWRFSSIHRPSQSIRCTLETWLSEGTNHEPAIDAHRRISRYCTLQAVKMSVPTIAPTIVAATAADGQSHTTVAVLEELLTQSIRLRDLYKNARWQISG